MIYYADFAQRQYEKNLTRCGRKFKFTHQPKLFLLADQLMKEKKYAPDVVVGLIKRQFLASDFACPKTLYNYIDLDLLQPKLTDLLLKVKRKEKKIVSRRNKRVLGTSIEKR